MTPGNAVLTRIPAKAWQTPSRAARNTLIHFNPSGPDLSPDGPFLGPIGAQIGLRFKQSPNKPYFGKQTKNSVHVNVFYRPISGKIGIW